MYGKYIHTHAHIQSQLCIHRHTHTHIFSVRVGELHCIPDALSIIFSNSIRAHQHATLTHTNKMFDFEAYLVLLPLLFEMPVYSKRCQPAAFGLNQNTDDSYTLLFEGQPPRHAHAHMLVRKFRHTSVQEGRQMIAHWPYVATRKTEPSHAKTMDTDERQNRRKVSVMLISGEPHFTDGGMRKKLKKERRRVRLRDRT